MSSIFVARDEAIQDQSVQCVSAPMRQLAAAVVRIAVTNIPVLITGETGTGKSTLARNVHRQSAARAAPLVVLHGATTSADAISKLLHLAQRAVLFEEVGELAPGAQDSLVGVMAAAGPGLRFIATSSCDLNELVARQVMRADLLYRLDVVRLDIPPLRERLDDVMPLAEHFLHLVTRGSQPRPMALAADAQERLSQHGWPGNIRELRNCIVESALHCTQAQLCAADLRLRLRPGPANLEAELNAALSRLHAADAQGFYARTQRLVLSWALMRSEGNRARAAATLGISRGSLRTKLRRLGLQGLRRIQRHPRAGASHDDARRSEPVLRPAQLAPLPKN